MGKLLNIKEVKAFMKNVPEDRKVVANGLFSKLEYMSGLLVKLENELDENIDVVYVRAYNETIQRYGIICKQLIAILPKSSDVTADPLISFIKEQP